MRVLPSNTANWVIPTTYGRHGGRAGQVECVVDAAGGCGSRCAAVGEAVTGSAVQASRASRARLVQAAVSSFSLNGSLATAGTPTTRGFGATNLADDQPVRPHPEGV